MNRRASGAAVCTMGDRAKLVAGIRTVAPFAGIFIFSLLAMLTLAWAAGRSKRPAGGTGRGDQVGVLAARAAGENG